jgi:hypothetical protein
MHEQRFLSCLQCWQPNLLHPRQLVIRARASSPLLHLRKPRPEPTQFLSPLYRYWRVTGVCMLSTKQFRSAEDVTNTVFSPRYVPPPPSTSEHRNMLYFIPAVLLGVALFPLARKVFLMVKASILLHYINVSRMRLPMYCSTAPIVVVAGSLYITPGSSNLQFPLHLEIDNSSTRYRLQMATPLDLSSISRKPIVLHLQDHDSSI